MMVKQAIELARDENLSHIDITLPSTEVSLVCYWGCRKQGQPESTPARDKEGRCTWQGTLGGGGGSLTGSP